jgi:hypothetical protein
MRAPTISHPSRTFAIAVLWSVSVFACGTAASGDEAEDVGADTVQQDISDDASSDIGSQDTADGAGDVTVEDAAPDLEECAAQGCVCDTAADCDSDYCLQDGEGGRYCADVCTTSCSTQDYRCVEFATDDTPGADSAFLCILQAYPYCGGCDADDDCAGFGVCTAQTDGDFCAPFCGANDPCPTGSDCVELDGAGDVPVCVPTLMQCADCLDPDDDGYGIGIGCLGVDCDEQNPARNAGITELCDGLDNDCDDRIDEDFNLTNDPNNCRACGNVCESNNGEATCRMGSCEVLSCDDGWGDCNSNGEDGCETDLNADSFCGVCAEGADRPGDLCGTCDSGAFACQDDGSVACNGDLEDAALNACGGCMVLLNAPGDICEVTGAWECDGTDALRCVVPGEVLVTTTSDAVADDGFCSLRELIISANTGTAVDTCGVATAIDVVRFADADATYTLTVVGADEDDAATGDLDILVPLTFEANGETVIDAAGLDRIFDVHEGASLTLTGFTLRGGDALGAHGGAIRTLGPLSATGCTFTGNASSGGDGQQDPGASGGGGGGGGVGLGGAIYSEGAALTLLSGVGECAFTGNAATGGAGANGVGNGGQFSGGLGGLGGGPNGGVGGTTGAGGAAGFGGGGGGGANERGTAGGAAGFGGGGGGGGANGGGGDTGPGGTAGTHGGVGGLGCCSASAGGGGGAGLGGAVFVNGGSLDITGCTFSNNTATGALNGRNHFGGAAPTPGEGRGGALYLLAPEAVSIDATFDANTASTGEDDVFGDGA